MTSDDASKNDRQPLLRRIESLSDDQLTKLRRKISDGRIPGQSLVAEALRRCGVKRVLGVAGTPIDGIFSHCWNREIRPIGVRDQQTAVIAAATANYIAGKLQSAVVVSAGPAVTNSLTGVLVARDNGWPVIVIGGRRPLYDQGIGYFQELNAVPIYESVTKWTATVEHASEIMPAITRAYEIACSGRPGPVYLDLPEDVLDAEAEAHSSLAPITLPPIQADAFVLEECGRLFFAAERPLLIIGEGIRWSFSEVALRELVEQSGIPFITTPLARGFLPDDHPLCANPIRRLIQSKADTVLLAGASFDWRFRFGAELAPESRVIHVDIDPVMLGKNVPDALTILADGGLFLTELRGELSNNRNRPVAALESWRDQIQRECASKRRDRAASIQQISLPMAPQQMFNALRDLVSKDMIVVLDGNVTLAAGQAMLSAQAPCGWLDPGWNGCMGAGIPMGIGAKLAAPERTVLVVCGDFGFGLSAMDLETAVRHRIPIIVVVMNNDGIMGRLRQESTLPADYPERFSSFQPELRYERIAEIFGGHAECVSEPQDLQPALERAMVAGVPACINVLVNPSASHPGFW